ncbi:MAG: hypothetical protein OXU31_04925, partial [Gammaproteobacteria bacterium]|nr:hypothetical protein [Gammaproteobacteria bacterium]
TVTGVAAGTATISHTVAGADYASVTAAGVTVTVTGPVGTVSLAGPAGPLAEGTAAVFTVTASDAQTAAVTVPYTIAGTGITAADVHGGLTGNEVIIPAGVLNARFTIHILVDGAGAETGDMLSVTLSAPTIPDNDGMATTTGAPALAASPANAVTVAIADTTETTAPAVATALAAQADAANAAPGDTSTFRVTISGFRPARAQVEWEVVLEGTNPAAADMFTDRRLASATTSGLPSGINGIVTVPAGHAQTADIRVRLHPRNRLSAGGTFNYKVRIRRTIQYTDAGARPATLPAVCATSCTEADGSIVIPAANATLTVARPPAVQDPFAANPDAGTSGGTFDSLQGGSGYGDSYTLREEWTRAQLREFHVRNLPPGSSLFPGQAAIFRVDLCPAGEAVCQPLGATQNVTFEFAIGGSNSGYGADDALEGKDYRTPRLDGATTSTATAVDGGARWRATIAAGKSAIFISVPLIDDDEAEPDETLNMRLVGTPTVAGSGGGSVTLAASPNDRSLDYTIIGAEPAAVTTSAGSLALAGSQPGGRVHGNRARFTVTLTDDDAADGDDTDGADATFRVWYALYATNTSGGTGDNNRHWSVLASTRPEGNDPAFFNLDASDDASRFRACDASGRCLPSAGDHLTRGGVGGAPKGYGWMIIPEGQTTATLDVVTNAHISSWDLAMAMFAVDDNSFTSGDTVLPAYDFRSTVNIDISGTGNVDAGRAFFAGAGFPAQTLSEGADDRNYPVNFRGNAPAGISSTNPVRVTWRLVGSVINSRNTLRYPATVGDLTVTAVTFNTGAGRITHDGTPGDDGTGTITSDAARNIIAQQTFMVNSWTDSAEQAFQVTLRVVDDGLSEPAEAYYFQVFTDHDAIGEIPGDGFIIPASDAATVTVEAIRGTDTDGDGGAGGSWQEVAPSGNDNPLRFRISITGGRPQQDALIGWALAQDADGANGDVSPGDFLQCLNTPNRRNYDEDEDDCSRTRRASILLFSSVRVSAALAGQATGPWTIDLPFLLNDDGAAESAEDFTIEVGAAARTSGINVGTPTNVDFTIAASTAESRLIVAVGDANCAAAGSSCTDSNNGLDTSGAVPAVNDRDAIRAPSTYQGNALSDYTIEFPVTFFLPDGGDADDAPDPLVEGHNANITGNVTVHYRIDGTIFDRATGGNTGGGTADLSTYPRTGEWTFNRYPVSISYLEDYRQRIRVKLPLARVTSATEPATFTITLTSVSMNPPSPRRGGGPAGLVELGADTQGQVQVRRSGGLFFITAAGQSASVAANRVAEDAGALTYNVQFYSGAGETIPAGGISLDWALSHGIAARDTICNECPEIVDGVGDTIAADFTGATTGTVTFAADAASGAIQTFTVTPMDDSDSETAEAFSLTISNLRVNGVAPTGDFWSLGRSVYTTIIDSSDPHVFTLDCPTTTVDEGATLACTVTHTGPTLADGTLLTWNLGTPNADYTAAPADFGETTALPRGMLTFTGGTAAFPAITITDDSDDEAAERFVVAIGSPRTAADAPLPNARVQVSGATGQAGEGAAIDVTITASDTRGVTLSATTVTVGDGSTAQYTVVLDTEPTGSVTVTPASAAAATATVSGALTFTTANYATPQAVTVTGAAEGNTTITHTVAGANYDGVTAPSVSVTVTAATIPQFSIAVASSVTDADSNA